MPEYVRPLFCEGKGPFRWVALSGDPDDIRVTDDAAPIVIGRDHLDTGSVASPYRETEGMRDGSAEAGGIRLPMREQGCA